MAVRRGTSQHARSSVRAESGLATPEQPLRWRRELALVLVCYWVYTLVRNLVQNQEKRATQNAHELYGWERALGIDIELTVNQTIDRITWLIVGMNYYYAVAHFAVTAAVLVWLYRRHPRRYRPARTAFLATNAAALTAFYLYPLTPPRLLPGEGFIDTVAIHHTWGSMASGDLANASNQYAAMPSMHVGWSIWCAIMVVLLARAWWLRLLVVAHPAATLVVIVATGNHFLLDAVGGVMALAAGHAIALVILAMWRRYRSRHPDSSASRVDELDPIQATA